MSGGQASVSLVDTPACPRFLHTGLSPHAPHRRVPRIFLHVLTGTLRLERLDGRGFAPGARRGPAERVRTDGLRKAQMVDEAVLLDATTEALL